MHANVGSKSNMLESWSFSPKKQNPIRKSYPQLQHSLCNTNTFVRWGMKTNLMSLVILFQLLRAQHVSLINISIFRSLRLCWWITTPVVLFSVRCVLQFLLWLIFGGVRVAGWSTASTCNTNTTSVFMYLRWWVNSTYIIEDHFQCKYYLPTTLDT